MSAAPRRAGGWLAAGSVAVCLAVSALPASAAVPGRPAPSHVVAPAPADVLDPARPLEAFPVQVARACETWGGLGWPGSNKPKDYRTVEGEFIRGGNPYRNRSGDLPLQDTYREYDVNARPTATTRRDAERLIRDQNTDQVWYTDDHYANFREITGGC